MPVFAYSPPKAEMTPECLLYDCPIASRSAFGYVEHGIIRAGCGEVIVAPPEEIPCDDKALFRLFDQCPDVVAAHSATPSRRTFMRNGVFRVANSRLVTNVLDSTTSYFRLI